MHVTAPYPLRVKERNHLLGAFDGAGRCVLDILSAYVADFDVETADGCAAPTGEDRARTERARGVAAARARGEERGDGKAG